MAKFNKGILGPFSGKVGPIIGSSWKNTNYIKAVPKETGTKKVKTEKQLANQAKFKFFNSWLEPFYPFVTIGFANYAKNISEINAAFKINYHQALSGNNPNYEINYEKVCLSKGNLNGLTGVSLSLVNENNLQLLWNSQNPLGQHDDQLMLVLYSPILGIADGCIGLAQRRDGKIGFTFNPKLIGQVLEVYLTVVSLNRKQVSSSQYLGRVEPL